MPPTPEPALTLDDVVVRLAATLGPEKSREVVTTAARALASFEADAVLDLLAQQYGVVGSAARFVLARTRVKKKGGSARPDNIPQSEPQRSLDRNATQEGGGQAKPRMVSSRAVVDLLAPSLGQEASNEIVQTTLRQLGFEADTLDLAGGLRLLETLAASPGLLGITARFAKARLILLFRAPPGGTSRETSQ